MALDGFFNSEGKPFTYTVKGVARRGLWRSSGCFGFGLVGGDKVLCVLLKGLTKKRIET